MSTSLFDAIGASSNVGMPRSASWFERANRAPDAAWMTVRETLDRWYSSYPDRTGDFRSRLRAKDQNSLSAFFELFLHELFLCAELQVTVAPELPTGTTPDFLVRGSAEHAVYIEATVVEGDRDNPHEQLVLDAISDLNDGVPRGLGVHAVTSGTLSAAPPIRRIKRSVRDWLNRVRIEGARGAPMQITIPQPAEDRDWRLTLDAVPREDGGVIQVAIRDVQEFGKSVEEALARKASQHRTDEWPVVLAVDDVNRHFDEGYLSFSKFWGGHPSIAAVLIFDRCVPWDDADRWGLHIETNPMWPGALPVELLTMGDSVAASIRELLGLPAGWPEPEPGQNDLAWCDPLHSSSG